MVQIGHTLASNRKSSNVEDLKGHITSVMMFSDPIKHFEATGGKDFQIYIFPRFYLRADIVERLSCHLQK